MKPAGFVRLAKTKISFVEPIFRWLFVVTDIRLFDETKRRDPRAVVLVTSVMQPNSFVLLSFVKGMSTGGLEEAGVVAGGWGRENKQQCQKYSSGVMAAWNKE
ncbi:unnamed protein product [Sphagnum tenellum]